MKIITLVENTSVSPEYKKKHGLCFYIETLHNKILFDLGPNGIFIENAAALDVDLTAVDTVVISHGHKDHAGALGDFLAINKQADIYIQRKAFLPYYTNVCGMKFYVGLDPLLEGSNQVVLTDNRVTIAEGMQLFSDVPGDDYLPESNRFLFIKEDSNYHYDTFKHEQNLLVIEGDKKILFAGCAHRGIVNIIKKAEQICGSELTHVISGFHLYNPVTGKIENNDLIEGVANSLLARKTLYYTCHCTGMKVFHKLKEYMNDRISYLSAGSVLEIE